MTCINQPNAEHGIKQFGVGRPKEKLWLQCVSDRGVPVRVNAETSKPHIGRHSGAEQAVIFAEFLLPSRIGEERVQAATNMLIEDHICAALSKVKFNGVEAM